MKVVYISGAYRASSQNEVFENIMRARAAAVKLWNQGYAVICPHTNSIFMDGVNTDTTFLEGDLELLKRCDCIYMLKGWYRSQGATAELELAKKLNMEIIYEEP
jgi:hypothetical protein